MVIFTKIDKIDYICTNYGCKLKISYMKRHLSLLSILLCLVACLPIQANGRFNVKDFGAKGDGVHIDSPAINAAIDAASEAGGGTVYFPAGTYSSYSIRLKSHI